MLFGVDGEHSGGKEEEKQDKILQAALTPSNFPKRSLTWRRVDSSRFTVLTRASTGPDPSRLFLLIMFVFVGFLKNKNK